CRRRAASARRHPSSDRPRGRCRSRSGGTARGAGILHGAHGSDGGDRIMTTRIGFIGIGMMGLPMSRNLLKAGLPLTVWNRSAAKLAPLLAEGAREARSPRELASASDVIITMLTGPAEVESVLLRPDGVIDGLRPGATVIDMSTNAPEMSRRLAAA